MAIHLLSVHNRLDLATKWCAFGQNPAVAAGAEHIWSQGATHTEIATAAALHVSSSSASDTFDVEIIGLDADWNPQTVIQTLVGQTETTVGTTETWIRVFSIRNVGAVVAVGDIYCYLDDTVTAGVPQTQGKIQLKMLIGYERSMAARLSVPVGKTGHIVQWGGFTSAAAASEIRLMYRQFGEIACIRRVLNVYSNGEMIDYIIPLPCIAKSDIFLVATGNGIISGEINGFYEDA